MIALSVSSSSGVTPWFIEASGYGGQRLRDGRVGDLAGLDVAARGQRRVGGAGPLGAEPGQLQRGRAAWRSVRARVEVLGTAPGMLPTQ